MVSGALSGWHTVGLAAIRIPATPSVDRAHVEVSIADRGYGSGKKADMMQ